MEMVMFKIIFLCNKLRNRRKNKPAKWFKDIDWQNIPEEKTNLAYDNAMAYLEDLDQSQKNLDNKALVFLSYLFTVCGVLLYNIFFRKEESSQIVFLNNMDLSKSILILCLGYAVLFCFTAMIFLSTQRRMNRFADPKSILLNPNNITQYIKNDICEGLQRAIVFNVNKQNRRALFLRLFLLISVIFPICLITYCLINISLILAIVLGFILLGCLWLLFRHYP